MSLSSYEVIWKQVLDQVEQSNFFTEDTLRWIKNTTLFKIENSIAYISYRSMVTKTILNKEETKNMITSVLSEVWGSDVTIQLIQYKDMEKLMPEEEIQQRTNQLLKCTFNEEYTFENFVEGKSNQEIAEQLELSVLTIKTHKKNAYNRLRERLGSFILLLF